MQRCASRGKAGSFISAAPLPTRFSALFTAGVFITDVASSAPRAMSRCARACAATLPEMPHKGEALSSTHKPYFRGMGNTHPYNYWSVNVKAQCAEVDVVIFLFFV